ncbi:MAG: hypothetical protein U0Z44_19220 [Kouleothrix sp.]
MRRANFALAILTYVLVFYATFLTRTGVLSSFSVHSFVAEGLGYIMTGFWPRWRCSIWLRRCAGATSPAGRSRRSCSRAIASSCSWPWACW